MDSIFNGSKKKIFISLVLYLLVVNIALGLGSLFEIHSVSAQYSNNNRDAWCVPSTCNNPGEYVPDVACVQKQLLNPAAKDPNSTEFCCANKCKVGGTTTTQPQTFRKLVSFFGGDIVIKEGKQIPVLINLLITTVLGLFTVYALVYGGYVAGFVRAGATDEDTITKANKDLINLGIGFVLAWGAIIIVQIVSNILGLGSLSDMQFVNSAGQGQGGSVIIIN